jgi:hypothetical protein
VFRYFDLKKNGTFTNFSEGTSAASPCCRESESSQLPLQEVPSPNRRNILKPMLNFPQARCGEISKDGHNVIIGSIGTGVEVKTEDEGRAYSLWI